MRKLWMIGTALAALTACGGNAECGAEQCEAYCATTAPDPAAAASADPGEQVAPDPQISSFESGLVSPIVEDIRGGVRPFDGEGIGICRGTKSCDEFLGADVGDLPAGDYMVKAEFRVPNTGDAYKWTIDFATECETTHVTDNGSSTTSSNNSRTYDVRYAGEQRGYRLMPLRTIESPSKGGSRKCTYTITAPHPDGDKVYKGSWSTADAG